MIFEYFNNTHGLLPTPEQILHGIVLAQIHLFNSFVVMNFKLVIGIYVNIWK